MMLRVSGSFKLLIAFLENSNFGACSIIIVKLLNTSRFNKNLEVLKSFVSPYTNICCNNPFLKALLFSILAPKASIFKSISDKKFAILVCSSSQGKGTLNFFKSPPLIELIVDPKSTSFNNL